MTGCKPTAQLVCTSAFGFTGLHNACTAPGACLNASASCAIQAVKLDHIQACAKVLCVQMQMHVVY